MTIIDQIENNQLKSNIPDFQPGDTVRVHVRIKEGDKERLQIFEGVVIARKHGGVRKIEHHHVGSAGELALHDFAAARGAIGGHRNG